MRIRGETLIKYNGNTLEMANDISSFSNVNWHCYHNIVVTNPTV